MSDDDDAWLYFDGPEPERFRPLLDALRDLPPATPEDEERVTRRFFEKLDAAISRRAELANAEERGASVSQDAPSAEPETRRLVVEEGVTARSPTFDERPYAPPPLVQYVPTPPAPAPQAPDPLEALKITAPLPDIPPELRAQMGKLPFKPAPPWSPKPVDVTNRTLEVPYMRRIGEQTAPVEDDSIEKPVPALPFLGNTVGTGIVPFPRLTLKQYVSFHVELSAHPERVGEIQRLYHVASNAARRALDEHWQKHFEEHPEARAMFEKYLAEYTDWVQKRGL